MAKFCTYLAYIVLLMSNSVIWGNSYASNIEELDSLKDLIQRLENTLTINEDKDIYPPVSEDAETPDVGETDSSFGALQRQEEREMMNTPNRVSPENPVLSRLRDLIGLTRTAKSSCFGNRIDRLHSSGFGCNSQRSGTKKNTFGK